MVLRVPELLSAEQVSAFREALAGAQWADGRVTAGYQSARAKQNTQLLESDPIARDLGAKITAALEKNALFISAALPLKVFPPLFNRYEGRQTFGNHIDNAIRQVPGSAHRVRTDLSATLFLSAPEEYDGGELVVEDRFGSHRVKLNAGDMIVYPASSLHNVTPVTRGCRLASFFWIQSMVRDDAARTILFDLDGAIRRFRDLAPDDAAFVQLTGVYHNLLRRWSDC
jgi:PKHD-type hydroxylase